MMLFASHRLWILGVLSSSFWQSVNGVACPSPGTGPSAPLTGSVTLDLSSSHQVCMLHRLTVETVETDDGPVTSTSFAPAGRSYNGRAWESVAGPYVATLTFDCSSSSSCSVVLPALEEAGQSFVLTSEERTITPEQEVARFLEQATFGPTRKDLNEWTYGETQFEDWIESQMTMTTVSEHRKHYRERANARATLMNDGFTSAVDTPCEENSRWRQYAFGWEENRYDMKIAISVPNGSTEYYLMTVNGEPRTEVLQSDWSPYIQTGKNYELCSTPDEYIGGALRVRVGSSCKTIRSGNPKIHFYETLPPNVLHLEAGDSLNPVDEEETNGEEVLLASTITRPVCDTLPKGSPVFALSADESTWYLHDPRIQMENNDVASPLSDGGGYTASGGVVQCANAPRTFLNKDSCVVSTSEDTCSCREKDECTTGAGLVVCGSPGEVANDPLFGDEYDMALDSDTDQTGNDDDFEVLRQTVWTTVSLYAPDQLRQRVAWALSQILTMAVNDIDAEDETEPFLVFYDIFVRHAFGNFYDILKEVSYSPMMAEMLTFLESKSMAYATDENGDVDVYPDENYAREVVQLFSVGLFKLNMDGTPVLDADGNPVETYDNDDIMDGARAWTGFKRQPSRGNIEDMRNRNNRIDPMRIDSEWRDYYPKMGLDGSYIGDGLPLCVDEPDLAFLKIGAKYRLLGPTDIPQLHLEDSDLDNNPNLLHLVLNTSSPLYQALCNAQDGVCSPALELELDSNLTCDGVECDIDQPRVVKLGDANIFFEYVKPACVQFPFFDNALKIKRRWTDSEAMCADPRMAVAGAACCDQGKNYYWRADRPCSFTGERVTYATAETQCAALPTPGQTCTWKSMSYIKSSGAVSGYCDKDTKCCEWEDGFFWSNVDCTITAKIDMEGKVALIHNHTDWNAGSSIWLGTIKDSLSPSNKNYFRVLWENDAYPDEVACSGTAGCEFVEDACVCSVSTLEEAVFTSLPTYAEAKESLQIGSASPLAKGCQQMGAPATDAAGKTIQAWDCSGSGTFNAQTVFELESAGISNYLRNAKSTVSIGTYQFRNPPHVVGMVEQDARDVEYEVDLVLEQYFRHSNTAPFLASRLIQRFGVSNPSPAYVKAVATAFATGSFEAFGSGKYGDMAATIAAILLHPEARSPSLDVDPSFGSLREPVLRMMHFMRAMEFEPNLDYFRQVKTLYVSDKIGQMAHAIPSVFSFFLPDYIPPGRTNDASLVSPEAEVSNTPTVLGVVGGIFSLIKYGLSECYGGFGPDTDGSCSNYPETKTKESPKAVGRLTYVPSEGVDMFTEMSLLLTAGRLDEKALHFLYEMSLGALDTEGASRIVQQLIASSPEFNANAVVKRGDMRPKRPTPLPSTKPYKAIVYFFQSGGMDSYNLVVPDHQTCAALYENYTTTRDLAALTTAEVGGPISAGGTQQGCDTFRLHKNLPFLESLYKAGELLISANTGMLMEPVTVEDWKDKHRGTSLFAHDVQQREAKQVDPFQENAGTGVLGRMTDALNRMADSFQTGSISLERTGQPLAGEARVSPPTSSVSYKGVNQFDPEPSVPGMVNGVIKLNNSTSYDSNVFGELWSEILSQALDENDAFYKALVNEDLELGGFQSSSTTAQKLETVAKLIKGHDRRGTDRDVFFVSHGGWDTHDNVKERIASNFGLIDSALDDFVKELQAQGVWDDVVIVTASDFGRSLTINSRDGTDHGWAGNYFVAGGNVKGGKMLGSYPMDYEDVNVGRYRLHPTTPWEAIWQGVAEWFGVEASALDTVLPNRAKFDSGSLFTMADMFEGAGSSTPARKLRGE